MAIPFWEPKASKQTSKLYDSAIEIAFDLLIECSEAPVIRLRGQTRQTKPAFAGLRNEESDIPFMKEAIEIASIQTKPAFAGLRNKESRKTGFCT